MDILGEKFIAYIKSEIWFISMVLKQSRAYLLLKCILHIY